MTPREIIRAMGGGSKLAEKLGCGAPAISNWLQTGIPKGRWPDLIEIAEKDGIEGITLDVLRKSASAEAEAA